MGFKHISMLVLALCLLVLVLYNLRLWPPPRDNEADGTSLLEDDLVQRCASLFSNNVTKSHGESKHLIPLKPHTFFLHLNREIGRNCKHFKESLFSRPIPIREEERQFPLGFLLTVFKDINQVARLLRLIHRPHNFYVIHVDKKSPRKFHKAVAEVAKCFGDNVGVVPLSESISVKRGDYTVLEQELVAARLLLKMGKWKYMINLTGQELPLKTNLELVLGLRMLNGSNLVQATFKRQMAIRIPNVTLSFPVSKQFFRSVSGVINTIEQQMVSHLPNLKSGVVRCWPPRMWSKCKVQNDLCPMFVAQETNVKLR
ncbi:unnamed protein product [Dibothriocephalus latus]|uniref:Protein xylosyltransferase n=1 Tax=Dibothriocephalus latus TaxID=60516 RepID=A0A3P7Q9Q9_DIBLA|nr:unnamed protein product [Dibothriocephalus latus]